MLILLCAAASAAAGAAAPPGKARAPTAPAAPAPKGAAPRGTAPAPAPKAEQGGVTYVCYCSRPQRDPDDAYDLYARRQLRMDLLDPLFKDGRDRPRFQHVATLDLPARMKQPPVQVYRLLPKSADAKAP